MKPPKIKMKCLACKARDWCRHAFGRYWFGKSNGGEGCEYPLPQDERTVAAHMKYVPAPSPF